MPDKRSGSLDVSGRVAADGAQMETGIKSLERTMGLASGTAMVIGLVIGSGIFTTPAIVWALCGSTGMAMIMWTLGAVITFLGALSYTELGLMLPVSGGDQAYLAFAYKTPRFLASFIFCWVMIIWVGPGVGAANSIAFGKYVLFAAYGSPSALPADSLVAQSYEWIARGFGTLCITSLVVLNVVSTRWSLRLLTAMTAVKLLLLVVLIIGGIVAMAGGISDVTLPGNWDDSFAGTATSPGTYAFVIFMLYWSFSGWNNLSVSLGELKRPERNLPLAALGGLGIVAVLYLLANMVFLSVVPAELALGPNKEIIAAVFTNIVFGEHVGRVVLPAFIALSTYSGVCASTFAAGRLILSAAQQRYLPFSQQLGRVHPRLGTPCYALALSWVLVMIMMFAPPPGEAFEFLVNLVTYPLGIIFGMTVAGLLILRRTEPEHARPFKVWWPLPAVFVVLSVFVAIFPFVQRPDNADAAIPYYLAPLLGLIVMLLGVPIWFVMIPNHGSVGRAVRYLRGQRDLNSTGYSTPTTATTTIVEVQQQSAQ